MQFFKVSIYYMESFNYKKNNEILIIILCFNLDMIRFRKKMYANKNFFKQLKGAVNFNSRIIMFQVPICL